MQLEDDEYSQLPGWSGVLHLQKAITDLFISGGVLLFFRRDQFLLEKLRTCYYLK